MNDVAVKGTGIVDALTLSGRSEIAWTEDYERIFWGSVELEGDLEAILELDGRKTQLKANSVVIPYNEIDFSRPITINGERKNRVTFSPDYGIDYYLMSIGQIKKYFRQVIIKTDGGVKSWDEIFERMTYGLSLIKTPEGLNPGIDIYKEREKIGGGNREQGERAVRIIALPLLNYWNRKDNEIVILKTLEPLKLVPMEIGEINMEINGAVEAAKVPGFSDPHFIYIDGKPHYAEKYAIRGQARGKIITAKFPSYQAPQAVTITTPAIINAEYARIGIGHLDYSRKELDDRVMEIKSTTSEELRDCEVMVNVTDDAHFSIDNAVKERLEAQKSDMKFWMSISVGSLLAGLGGFLSGNYETPGVFVSYCFGVGGAVFFFIELNGYRNTKKNLYHQDFANTQLDISYSGTQTSRWLQRYPQYEELGRRLTQPE